MAQHREGALRSTSLVKLFRNVRANRRLQADAAKHVRWQRASGARLKRHLLAAPIGGEDMGVTYQPLGEGEREWVSIQMQVLEEVMRAYSPADVGLPLSAAALDRAFAAWLPQAGDDLGFINSVINAIGVGFGSLLVNAGFDWVIATDEQGSDLAVRALPDTADVLVYPANFVAKRFQSCETGFLEDAHDRMVAKVRELSGSKPKRPFWKRGG